MQRAGAMVYDGSVIYGSGKSYHIINMLILMSQMFHVLESVSWNPVHSIADKDQFVAHIIKYI